MSLDDLVPDDAGEAKGGRPPEGGNQERREVYGDPFLPHKDTEEWWQEKFDDLVSTENEFMTEPLDAQPFEFIAERIGELSDHIGLHPVEIRKRLGELDLYETDWDEYIEFYDESTLDSRVPGVEGEDFEPEVEEFEDSDIEINRGGLMGLVDNARREDEEPEGT